MLVHPPIASQCWLRQALLMITGSASSTLPSLNLDPWLRVPYRPRTRPSPFTISYGELRRSGWVWQWEEEGDVVIWGRDKERNNYVPPWDVQQQRCGISNAPRTFLIARVIVIIAYHCSINSSSGVGPPPTPPTHPLVHCTTPRSSYMLPVMLLNSLHSPVWHGPLPFIFIFYFPPNLFCHQCGL